MVLVFFYPENGHGGVVVADCEAAQDVLPDAGNEVIGDTDEVETLLFDPDQGQEDDGVADEKRAVEVGWRPLLLFSCRYRITFIPSAIISSLSVFVIRSNS